MDMHAMLILFVPALIVLFTLKMGTVKQRNNEYGTYWDIPVVDPADPPEPFKPYERTLLDEFDGPPRSQPTIDGRSGWVYVLTNRAMPDLIKVGFTRRQMQARLSELSSTEVPHPFDVAYCIWVPNPKAVEAQAHRNLRQYRVNQWREFFRVPVSTARELIRALSPEGNQSVMVGTDSPEAAQHAKDEVARYKREIQQHKKGAKDQKTFIRDNMPMILKHHRNRFSLGFINKSDEDQVKEVLEVWNNGCLSYYMPTQTEW